MRIDQRPLQGVQLAVQVHQLRAQRLDVVVRQPLLPQLRQRLPTLRSKMRAASVSTLGCTQVAFVFQRAARTLPVW